MDEAVDPTADRETIRHEYLDASNNVRRHGNLRFAQLALFSALTGALITVLFGRAVRAVQLELLGLVVAAAFLVMEWRTGVYWEHYRARAAELEPRLGYAQYRLLPRRKGLVTARSATRALYLVVILLWALALLSETWSRTVPPTVAH
jgi:hypothetical protein